MAKYEIDNVVLKNILVFLSRTKLEGAEVPEFNKVMNVLTNPIVEQEQKQDKKQDQKQDTKQGQ